MFVPVAGLLITGFYLREDNRIPKAPPQFIEALGAYHSFSSPPSSAPPGTPHSLGNPLTGNYETWVNVIIQYGEPRLFMRSTRKPNWQIERVEIVDNKGFPCARPLRFELHHLEDQEYTLFCVVPLSKIPRNKGQSILKAVVIADGRWTLPISVQLRNKDGRDIFTKSAMDAMNEAV